MRYQIELHSNDRNLLICDYLKHVADKGTPRKDVAAQLLGYPSA